MVIPHTGHNATTSAIAVPCTYPVITTRTTTATQDTYLPPNRYNLIVFYQTPEYPSYVPEHHTQSTTTNDSSKIPTQMPKTYIYGPNIRPWLSETSLFKPSSSTFEEIWPFLFV